MHTCTHTGASSGNDGSWQWCLYQRAPLTSGNIIHCSFPTGRRKRRAIETRILKQTLEVKENHMVFFTGKNLNPLCLLFWKKWKH